MKKHSLLKVILIVLGALVGVNAILAILGYFVKGLSGTYTMIPLLDLLTNYVQSFYYFFDTLVFLLAIGGFYAVLKKVPAYNKLLDNIVQKVKSHGKLFVFVVTGLFAVLTSVTGLVNVLLVFVPFVVAIILLLGYDKLVAVSSTIVAMLVGFMGGIFVTFRDANSYYGYSATTLEKMAGLDAYANLWPKLVLLVLGTALLMYFVNKHINAVQDKKVKYELNESDEVAVKEVAGDYKNIKTWPMIVIFALMFVIFILGYLPWNTLFGIECFDKFNEWLLGIKIGEFAVFSNIVSGNLVSFGSFASLGSYMAIVITLIIFTLIIKLVYKVKFNELLNDFVSGAKTMVPMILLVVLAYSILVDAYNHGFMSNILTWITGLSFGKNFVCASVITALGTLLHSDLYYTVSGVFAPLLNAVEDETLFATYTLTFQSVYGLVSMIAPTSLLVIFAMKYFDIPYTTWVKYIWRFILMLFLLVILVLLVVSLL